MNSQGIKTKQFSAICGNGDFLHILTRSGVTSAFRDPLGPEYLLPGDAAAETIGAALMDCLSHSRFLPYEEHPDFYDLKARRLEGDQWVAVMMEKYKYKTKRALLSGLDACSVTKFNGKIVIEPSCHVKPLVWVRRTTDQFEDVVISDKSSPIEIGEAAKLALSRCTTG